MIVSTSCCELKEILESESRQPQQRVLQPHSARPHCNMLDVLLDLLRNASEIRSDISAEADTVERNRSPLLVIKTLKATFNQVSSKMFFQKQITRESRHINLLFHSNWKLMSAVDVIKIYSPFKLLSSPVVLIY